MPYTAGSEITASEFNDLVILVNKYWGDNVSGSAAVTDSDKTLHKFGWGQTHALELSGLVNQRVTQGSDLVSAVHMNQLVARANATGLHLGLGTNLSYKIIDAIVLATDAATVENRFSSTVIDVGLSDPRSTRIDGKHIIGTGNSNTATFGSITRSSNWVEILISEQEMTFDSYNEARYFFNSGGALTIGWDLTSAVSTESQNWAANFSAMGTMHFLADDTVVSGTGGYAAADAGFYQLTTDYQLLYSYSFGSGVGTGTYNSGTFTGGDVNVGAGAHVRGGYLYGGTYAINRISLYGKYSDNGRKVHFKAYLQTPDDGSPIDGTLTQSLGYVFADDQTASGGTGAAAASTTFSVSSGSTNYLPTGHTVTNNLTSSDDR